MSDTDNFSEVEHDGVVRKCFVNLVEPENLVSVGSPINPDWIMSDADMLKEISRPDREPFLTTFSDPTWIQKTDQKSVGSCNPWSTADIFTFAHYIRSGNMKIFDGAYIYSLLTQYPTDHGSAVVDAMKVAMSKGTVTVEDNGPLNWDRRKTTQLDSIAAQTKLDPDTVVQFKNMREIKSYILRMGKAGVVNNVIQVPNGTAFASYKQGSTWTKTAPCGHGGGNHSITGVDVINFKGKPILLEANHWNLGFGANGFFIVDDESVDSCIGNHGSFGASMTIETTDPLLA